MEKLTAEQFEKLQIDGQDFLLVNTLDEEYFEETRLPEAVNIPFSRGDFVSRIIHRAGSRERRIVLYCASRHCHVSHEAAEKLEEAGFTQIADLSDGAEGWMQTTFSPSHAAW